MVDGGAAGRGDKEFGGRISAGLLPPQPGLGSSLPTPAARVGWVECGPAS